MPIAALRNSTIGIVLLIIGPPSVLADSNATGEFGTVVNSETLDFDSGPYSSAGAFGDVENGTFTGSFTGGFDANQLSWSGSQTSVIAATFGQEAALDVTAPSGEFTGFRLNPGLQTYSGTVDFSGTLADISDLSSIGGSTIDPIGTWEFQFFETFDDGPGADQTIDSFSLTFEEVSRGSDESGDFLAGDLAIGDTYQTVGEFASAGLLDTYSLSLLENSIVTFETFADADGFTGLEADTELAVFDADGLLIDTNDDIDFLGGNTFSILEDLLLTAGDYTVAVGTFNTNFDDGIALGDVVGGDGLGDYAMSISVTAVPEPGSVLGLSLIGGLLALRRRRSSYCG